MLLASDHWYASGTFWAVAGVAVAVIGVAIAVATYFGSVPRRRLLYSMETPTPLLTTIRDIEHELEVRLGGKLLSAPHILTIQVASRGRRDIPSSSFDGAQPIQLDVGVPILKILRVHSDSDALPDPPAEADGSVLRVGPGLLGRRHTMTYTLNVIQNFTIQVDRIRVLR